MRTEVNSHSPFLVGKLQTGDYDLFLVAPVTANSTAKIATGIADTLHHQRRFTSGQGDGARLLFPAGQ